MPRNFYLRCTLPKINETPAEEFLPKLPVSCIDKNPKLSRVPSIKDQLLELKLSLTGFRIGAGSLGALPTK